MATSAVLGPSGLSYQGPSPIAIGRTLALLVAGVGAVVLAGWILRVEILTSLWPGAPPMRANSAFGLILAGLALWLAPLPATSWARPLRLALAAAVLFGFANSLKDQLGIIGSTIPSQFLAMLPYLATILAVAGFVGHARPPAAEGKPYKK